MSPDRAAPVEIFTTPERHPKGVFAKQMISKGILIPGLYFIRTLARPRTME
jgi:hypothetical protein